MAENHISYEYRMDLGRLGEIAKGLPARDLKNMGQIVAAAMGRRIRDLQATFDGERLDPNADGWADTKIEQGGAATPLVDEGTMTEPNAWEVTVDVKTGGITLSLNGEHREKWDNIMNIAETENKNWNKGWGLGESEKGMLINNLNQWLARLIAKG